VGEVYGGEKPEYSFESLTLPTQYAMRYIAAEVVFFVHPAILEESRLSKQTNPVDADWYR
jgi:hypothetical protein